MFIRIENHIINIAEIRNVSVENLGYGKGTLKIVFRTGGDNISFASRKMDELDVIMDTLTDACKLYR